MSTNFLINFLFETNIFLVLLAAGLYTLTSSINMSLQSVQSRKLGKDGPTVPALGFGLMVLAGAYGAPPSDEQQFQLLDRAFELGARFWDTSK